MLSSLLPARHARRLRNRPFVELQTGRADCGYVSASAFLALLGSPYSVAEIKNRAGNATRGMTLRQLRDALISCGLRADAIRFDTSRSECLPVPGIVLLKRGHYIVLGRAFGKKVDVFYPEKGWVARKRLSLAAELNGFGVQACVADNPTWGKEQSNNTKSSSPIKTLSLLLRSVVRRKQFLAVAFVSIAGQVVILGLPWLMMQLADSVRMGSAYPTSMKAAVAFVLVTIFGLLSSLASAVLNRKVVSSVSRLLASQVFDNLLQRPCSWFEEVSQEVVRNGITSIDALLRYITGALPQLTGAVLTVCVGLLTIACISPVIIIPALMLSIFVLLIELVTSDWFCSALAESVEATQARQQFVNDVLNQIPLIKRVRRPEATRRRYVSLTRKACKADYDVAFITGIRMSLIAGARVLENITFIVLAAFLMHRGKYSIGAFVAVGAYKDQISQALTTLLQAYSSLRGYSVHIQQADGILGASAPISPDRHRTEVSNGSVSLINVSFHYSVGEVALLRDVSLEIKPGAIAAICGASGSGKSTLAKLICGSLSPTAGRVLVGGCLPHSGLAGFGAVLQSDRLVYGSIRENLGLFSDRDDQAALLWALDVVSLTDLVKQLPLALETIVGEGIGGISAGQRSRLLIARALLARPKILLLDEATSTLDTETEGLVLHRLRNHVETIVLITHRADVWALADSVIEIKDGQASRIQYDRVREAA